MTENQKYRRELVKVFYTSFPLLFIAIIGVVLVEFGKWIQKPFDKLQIKIEFGLIVDEAFELHEKDKDSTTY